MAEKDRIRKHDIKIRVTETERNLALEHANKLNMNINEYVRYLLMNGIIVKYEAFDMKNLSEKLHVIGCNINQIAKRINEKGGILQKKRF